MDDTPRDEVKRAHDQLSALLEDDDAGNDAVRDAAVNLTRALNRFWDSEELIGSNPRVDGQRIAWSDTAWLYPGDEIVLLHGGGK